MLEYIERITVFIIAEGIILRLTTNEDYKKMIKICSGMILTIIVLSPLDKVFGFTETVTDFLQEITGENRLEEAKEVFSQSDEKNVESLRSEYEDVLAEGLRGVAGEYGYEVIDVNVVFDENRPDYIGSVSVYLADASDEGDIAGNGAYTDNESCIDDNIKAVERVEPVRIDEEGGESLEVSDKREIELPDIIAIKNSIVDKYGIAYERICIYK